MSVFCGPRNIGTVITSAGGAAARIAVPLARPTEACGWWKAPRVERMDGTKESCTGAIGAPCRALLERIIVSATAARRCSLRAVGMGKENESNVVCISTRQVWEQTRRWWFSEWNRGETGKAQGETLRGGTPWRGLAGQVQVITALEVIDA